MYEDVLINCILALFLGFGLGMLKTLFRKIKTMKNIFVLFFIIILVSCGKDERVYGKWKVVESYSRENNNQNWAIQNGSNGLEVNITKDSWYPLIEGNCITKDGVITTNSNYNYEYTLNKNEMEFRVYNSSNWIWKRKLIKL